MNSQSLEIFSKIVEEEPSILIEGLWDAPKACIAHLAQKQTKKNILIITHSSKESKVVDDAPYFRISNVSEIPPWETLPGEETAPSPDIIGKRMEILYSLQNSLSPQLLVCPLQSALQKVPSPKLLNALSSIFKPGHTIQFSSLHSLLSTMGYHRSPVVNDKGQFAIRGGILDIFPISSTDPYRVEFLENSIETIRSFDPVGQKSIEKIDSFFLSPASELALLQQEATTLLSYLGQNTIVIFDDLLKIEDHLIAFQNLPGATSKFFLPFNDFLHKVKNLSAIYWTKEPMEELCSVTLDKKIGRSFYSEKASLQPISFEFFHHKFQTKRWNHPFLPIDHYLPDLNTSRNFSIRFICSSSSEEKIVEEKFPIKKTIERGYLSSGFGLKDSEILLIPMIELTHKQKIRREKWRSTYHTPPSDFYELQPGDLVVHFHHGIAKYRGIEKKQNHLKVETEFLVLEYAEGGKLFVPIGQSHLVSRYIGGQEQSPSLHTLGTKNWQKTKATAQKAIIGYAQHLLLIAAERTLHGGFSYPEDSKETKEFEEAFPYVATEDQLQAIAEIKKEMTSSKAMDRLLCGDVGYGKTEVAMRAAFKAAIDGKKQVAMLVPTTVLALQHYETFVDRMANYPITIKVISRFQSPSEIKKTISDIFNGKVDIVIGTHRLLSKDVLFKNLGLIIIDEEQRFGVRAKEHLKKLKIGVDCLTLTATPIPRTLHLSLVGAKEISLINSPPQDRLPIKTIVAERDPELILHALLREMSREGQVYFIHNRIESINLVAAEIQKLVPQARIIIGHGQMPSHQLDTIFHAFKTGQADILVATTIIESGIDIPNANTILIDRADQFGLSDLYQLRGRVGRWNRPAFAYLLTPRLQKMQENASKRLVALTGAKGYGEGMKVAMRDLEIRGAGDILGTQQSGHVSSIGFHLYCKLLNQTIIAIKNNQDPSFLETKMEFPYNASIPESYIDETSIRLEIYHRLGESLTVDDIQNLFEELKDRFGKLPIEAVWLYHLSKIHIIAKRKKFTLLKFNTHSLETEQYTPKGTVKKSFHLKDYKSPALLEKYIIGVLES
jgi:transcription-repair coupling factor (superfamily II helicase)